MMRRALVLSAALVAALALQPRVVAAVTPVCGNGPCQSAGFTQAPVLVNMYTQVANNPSNPQTLSIPSGMGTHSGNTLLVMTVQNGSTAQTTPTGWTFLNGVSESGGTGFMAFYTRAATGTDPFSIATGGAGSNWAATLLEFSGTRTVANFTTQLTLVLGICGAGAITTSAGSAQTLVMFMDGDTVTAFIPEGPLGFTSFWSGAFSGTGRVQGVAIREIYGAQTITSAGYWNGGGNFNYCPFVTVT